MSAPARPVVASFRALLRVVKETFKGDAQALRTCRVEARNQYLKHAGERDATRIARLVADAVDAAQFLRESVVQAALNEQGNYAMQLKPQPGGGSSAGQPIAVQPARAAQAGASAQAEGGCSKPGGCGCG